MKFIKRLLLVVHKFLSIPSFPLLCGDDDDDADDADDVYDDDDEDDEGWAKNKADGGKWKFLLNLNFLATKKTQLS